LIARKPPRSVVVASTVSLIASSVGQTPSC
jgi:hypothetical protein